MKKSKQKSLLFSGETKGKNEVGENPVKDTIRFLKRRMHDFGGKITLVFRKERGYTEMMFKVYS